ncbi:MAG: hypothetical protein A3F18_00070 [Legionellales bacterium RIFCSPHIGHO2_12_FULL_37_14]|nr:MAG: hypothetical protein A3F18_00070 [Legionellales bacterium RIFCSPHIGHO2_12_FULL_37_14]
MLKLVKKISFYVLLLQINLAMAAAPTFLLTHNQTDVESNAYIDGTIPSIYPTKPHSDSKVYWNMVRVACHGHTANNICTALIKMASNTPNPIDVGYVNLDLTTGEITPKVISNNGYTLTVNGPGETTLTKAIQSPKS